MSRMYRKDAAIDLGLTAALGRHGFAKLGPADGLVKTAIFGGNTARLYGLHTRAALGEITRDRIAAIRTEYVAAGGTRSNTRYGYVARAIA